MTFHEQLQQAADAGHRQKIADERDAALARADAEARRLHEQAVQTAAAMDILILRMQAAARKGETMCIAHTIPLSEICLAMAVRDRCPLRAKSLTGVSLRLFNLLEEKKLKPRLAVAEPNVHVIQIPVLPPTADAGA